MTAPTEAPALNSRVRLGKGKTIWLVQGIRDGLANLTKEGSNGYVNTTAEIGRLVPVTD